jgi:NAD-dependent deacetylase sirtuin 4
MASALPNESHHILKSLTMNGYIQNIITQNVDNLHVKALTPKDKLIELHGTLQKVECMNCGESNVDRNLYQNRIHARNPSWGELIGKGNINPDGDVELPNGISYDDFDIPPCLSCGSLKMKPNVVFFGENIKKITTKKAEEYVNDSTAILVLGTSLATYSSYKLIRQANILNKQIGIITKGPTRADNLMDWKGQVGCTPVLKSLFNLIGP